MRPLKRTASLSARMVGVYSRFWLNACRWWYHCWHRVSVEQWLVFWMCLRFNSFQMWHHNETNSINRRRMVAVRSESKSMQTTCRWSRWKGVAMRTTFAMTHATRTRNCAILISSVACTITVTRMKNQRPDLSWSRGARPQRKCCGPVQWRSGVARIWIHRSVRATAAASRIVDRSATMERGENRNIQVTNGTGRRSKCQTMDGRTQTIFNNIWRRDGNAFTFSLTAATTSQGHEWIHMRTC